MMLPLVCCGGNNGTVFCTETLCFIRAWERRQKRREKKNRQGRRQTVPQGSCKENHLGMKPGLHVCCSSVVTCLLFWRSGMGQRLPTTSLQSSASAGTLTLEGPETHLTGTGSRFHCRLGQVIRQRHLLFIMMWFIQNKERVLGRKITRFFFLSLEKNVLSVAYQKASNLSGRVRNLHLYSHTKTVLFKKNSKRKTLSYFYICWHFSSAWIFCCRFGFFLIYIWGFFCA